MAMNRFWKMLLIMVTIIIVDQLSKSSIEATMEYGQAIPVLKGFFNISYVKNTGAAFGMGAGSSETFRIIMFLALPTLVCFGLFYYIIKSLMGPLHMLLAYSFILAGAIGNLIDRYTLGYVVDFLDFHWGYSHFPSFNVADMSITLAGIIIAYDMLFIKEEVLEEKTKSEA
jgi:signal peptidase II